MCMKEELLKDEWIQIENTYTHKIKIHLDILLHMPLIFLNTNVKLITFMVIFALRKECNQNDEIISLCNTILSGISFDIDKGMTYMYEYMKTFSFQIF